MTTRRTRGIVLAIAAHAESDKLVTLYSPDLGLVTGIAKGAKRSKHRFVNKLEEFTLLSVLYRPPRSGSLLFLSEADLDNAFLSLRRDYSRYTTAMFVTELVLRFTREHDPDPAVFALLHWALFSLDKGAQPSRIAALFLLRLLGLAGYQPGLDACGLCHTPVSAKLGYLLDPASGSLVCSLCRRETYATSGRTLSLQTIRFLQRAQQLELRLLVRLQMPSRAAGETIDALTAYCRHLLQQDIHSRRFLSRAGVRNCRSAPAAPRH